MGRVLLEPAVDPAPVELIQRQPFAQPFDILASIPDGLDVVRIQLGLDVLE